MKILPGWRQWLSRLVNPDTSPEILELQQRHRESAPILWMMGKTGAGKSSIIQRLTGDSKVQIGDGFTPCTNGSAYYDHPASAPVMRFLDTRGLGEAGYDPTEDIAFAHRGSHAMLIITRLDDPSQDEICRALNAMKLSATDMAVLHVHSAMHAIDQSQLERARLHNESQIRNALGFSIPSVCIDFTEPDDGFEDPDRGLPELRQAIIDIVPDLSRVLVQKTAKDEEGSLFLNRRKEILGYAGIAAATDLVPAVGLIAVPSIQGKLMHTLAAHYGVDWNRRVASEFIAALGSTFLYRYLWSLAGRQLIKFVPVYGQSAGAAAAASISFASTYALGRAACLYLYRRHHREAIDPHSLRQAFSDAFSEQR